MRDGYHPSALPNITGNTFLLHTKNFTYIHYKEWSICLQAISSGINKAFCLSTFTPLGGSTNSEENSTPHKQVQKRRLTPEVSPLLNLSATDTSLFAVWWFKTHLCRDKLSLPRQNLFFFFLKLTIAYEK